MKPLCPSMSHSSMGQKCRGRGARLLLHCYSLQVSAMYLRGGKRASRVSVYSALQRCRHIQGLKHIQKPLYLPSCMSDTSCTLSTNYNSNKIHTSKIRRSSITNPHETSCMRTVARTAKSGSALARNDVATVSKVFFSFFSMILFWDKIAQCSKCYVLA